MLEQIPSKMVGTKKENVYRKKREGNPFSGVQKQAKRVTETAEIVDRTPSTSPHARAPCIALTQDLLLRDHSKWSRFFSSAVFRRFITEYMILVQRS